MRTPPPRSGAERPSPQRILTLVIPVLVVMVVVIIVLVSLSGRTGSPKNNTQSASGGAQPSAATSP